MPSIPYFTANLSLDTLKSEITDTKEGKYKSTMKRIPVLLDDETHEELRKLAFDTRISISEHIRRAVKKYLQEISQDTE